MPSPFPGMDPYLEDPGLWPDVHHELISAAREILAEQLRPKYSVRIEDRVYISDEHDIGRTMIIPDLRIIPRAAGPMSAGSDRGQLVAEVEPIEATTLIEDEIHEPRIEIIDREHRHVVTVIEILSPANKLIGSRGRDSYAQKRRELMQSPTHFIEIDLLRAGDTFPPHESLPRHDYRVHLSRVQRRPRGMLWPIRLEQRLPRIHIPLSPDDPDSELDLQLALGTAYERAGYDLEIDYRTEPRPPLTQDQAKWANALLLEKKLR